MLRVPPDRHPDAVIVPRPFRGTFEAAAMIQDLFRPVFDPNVPKLYVFAHNAGYFYVAAGPDQTINFPKHGEHASQPRYDWFVVGESDSAPLTAVRPVRTFDAEPKTIRFGYLRDMTQVVDAHGNPADAVKQDYAAQFAALRNRTGRVADLIAKKDPTADEKAELSRLQAEVAKAAPGAR